MNHQTATAILEFLQALGNVNSWCGATYLQKTAYFLQELGGVGLQLHPDFILYKHGPYSFGLQDLMSELIAYGFLTQKLNPPPYTPSLRLTDSGGRFLERSNTAVRHAAAAGFVARKLGSKDVVALEKLGTALFIKRAWPTMTAEDQAQKVNSLKPHVSVAEAMRAAEEVSRLEQEAYIGSEHS